MREPAERRNGLACWPDDRTGTPTADNRVGFMVLDPKRMGGARFDLIAQQVIDLCRGRGR
jgi:hypothetical protein